MTAATVDFWRQQDLVTPEQLSFPLTLIGAGGIGSHAALALAKMGCSSLAVWDPDTVEPHNVPNQLYSTSHVGHSKVAALRLILRDLAGMEIEVHEARFPDRLPVAGAVVSAVDSMASRSRIWDVLRFNIGVPVYIDARMGAEVCRVLTVDPTDPMSVEAYEATLYTDEVADADACTAQAIAYNVLAAASLVAMVVKRHAVGDAPARQIVFDMKTLTLIADEP